MAEQEFYRLELVVSANGVESTKRELRAMDKFIESTRRRGELLSRLQMSPAVRLNDRASEPLRRVEGKLKALRSTTWEVTIGVRDLATGTLTRIGRMARALARTTFSLPTAIAGSAAVYAGVLSPLKAAGQFEQTQIGFETMLGSAEKANQFISDLQDFAAKTPFEFLQLTDASKRLLAFGFSAEQILPMMTAVGNAAAGLGLGAEGIDRITLALGQMRAKSKVSAEEMLQLTEAGVPAWDILAKKMGITTQQVMKLSEKGLIPAQQAIDAFIEGMNERFPDMMERQSKSLLGLWSNMKDVFSNKIFLRWGQGLADALKPRFERLNRWIDENETTIVRWGESLKKAAESGADWVLRKLEKAFGYIRRQYLDNPEFNKLDFGGKIRFIFDDLNRLFMEWWQAKGQQQVENISGKIGAALGGALGGFIMTALGAADPNSQIAESPFIQAGATAGHAFLESFLEAFDAAKIAKKAADAFMNMQPTWLGGETSSPTGQALALLLDAWLIAKVGKLLKGPFKAVRTASRWWKGGAAAETAATATAATTRTAATAADTATRTPWYQRWFGGLKDSSPAPLPPTTNAGPAAIFPQGYRPAGARFWENIPLDRVYSRDEIVRMANAGQLQRFNDLEKAFGGPITPKKSWWQKLIPKGGGSRGLGFLSRTVGKLAIPLSLGLDTVSIAAAAPGTERNRAIGGTVGGWGGFAAGSAAGAAIGSVVPGLGTAIGGTIGGIVGSLAGGAVGEWIGSKGKEISQWFSGTLWPSLKSGASDTWNWISDTAPQAIAKGIGFAVGYIGETLFNGEWWAEKWNGVREWAASTWENAKEIWNNTREAIGNTIFNGEWWAEKWNGVREWAANVWENAKEIWNNTREAIGNTLFNSEWWNAKWDNVRSWASNAWESIKSGWGKFWDKVSSAFEEGRQAGQAAAGAKAYAWGGFITRPHFGLVGEAGPEAIIPLSSRLRSRALELWQETGRRLGVKRFEYGGFTAPVAVAGAGMSAPVVNLNFDLAGLVGQITVQSRDDLDQAADKIAATIAAKLKAIFNNLPG